MGILDQPGIAEPGGTTAPTVPPIEELTPELTRKRRGQLRIIFDRFIRNRVAVLGMIVLTIVVLLAVFAPIITHQTATYDPANDPTPNSFAPLSLAHPLGTDELGRDVLARLLFGAQVSLIVGATSMAVAIVIGVGVGALAGFYGGWVDNILMRVVDSLLALPYLLLLFVLSLTFSNGSVGSVVFLIAILAWPATARIVRGQFLTLKER